MEIKLTRYYQRKGATDGILSVQHKRLCDTAEHAPTSLPPGKYVIKPQFYPMPLARIMPAIYTSQGKKSMGCLRPGNGVYRLHDSSIIVGEHQASGLCVHSGFTFGKLYQRIRKCWQRNEAVFLIVERGY